MSLYKRIAEEGLSPQQQHRLFLNEMTLYRNALDHEVARWQADPFSEDFPEPDRDLQMFETLWGAFARTGIVEQPSASYASENWPDLDEEEQMRLRRLIGDTPKFAENFNKEAAAALARIALTATTTNLPLAAKLVMLARMTGAWACRHGVDIAAIAGEASTAAAASPVATVIESGLIPSIEETIPTEWRDLTPTQVAERLIADTPDMFEHRRGGKRATEQVGEQTLRQIRWAASLLERSCPPGQPLWKLSFEDVKKLDKAFDDLPITFGKSPEDRRPETTLAIAIERAVTKVEEGDISAGDIGLQIPTCNKHYRKLAQIHEFMRSKVPQLSAIDFAKFIQPDRKDERLARLRYSFEQGQAIFSLAPWTGCVGEQDRLTPGVVVIHDSLFYALLLVWYTGARREEICKLRLCDIDTADGINFLRIAPTDTGRIKNVTSQRCIPIAAELVRLGFIHYVEALRSAGDTLLFPELEPADGTKRKRGDVFYKLWWIYLKPLIPGLVRGQAMHSARHMVSDELKQQEIFLEFRNDLLGQKTAGGDGATRYPSPAKLRTVLDIVDRIPIVTAHLPTVVAKDIKLLSRARRSQRPSRSRRD